MWELNAGVFRHIGNLDRQLTKAGVQVWQMLRSTTYSQDSRASCVRTMTPALGIAAKMSSTLRSSTVVTSAGKEFSS